MDSIQLRGWIRYDSLAGDSDQIVRHSSHSTRQCQTQDGTDRCGSVLAADIASICCSSELFLPGSDFLRQELPEGYQCWRPDIQHPQRRLLSSVVQDPVSNTNSVAEVIGFDHVGAHPFVGTWGPGQDKFQILE